MKQSSLTTPHEKLIKIGAKVVHQVRHVSFQLTEVAVAHRLYRAIVERIRRFAAPSWGGTRPGAGDFAHFQATQIRNTQGAIHSCTMSRCAFQSCCG